MDKEYHMNMASGFCGPNDCYIHTEMKAGKAPKTILAGDMMGMLWGVSAELHRIAEISNNSFQETVNAMMVLNEVGYSEAKRMTAGQETKRWIGEDQEKELMEKLTAEADRKAELKVKNLQIDLNNKNKECIKYQTAAAYIKASAEAREQTLTEENKTLSKQIRQLEGRIREMEKKSLFAEDDE